MLFDMHCYIGEKDMLYKKLTDVPEASPEESAEILEEIGKLREEDLKVVSKEMLEV